MMVRTVFPFFWGIFFPQMPQVCIVPTLFAAARPGKITTRCLEFPSALAYAKGFSALRSQQSNAKFIYCTFHRSASFAFASFGEFRNVALSLPMAFTDTLPHGLWV